jgi:uroporphyrinogen-III synthase
LKKSLVLVVREFDKFSYLFKENGFEVVNFPAIQTLPFEDFGGLKEKIDSLKNYDGLFFTSPKAAEVFLQNFENKENDFHGKIYVLGNRTKLLFENTNFEIAFRADANTAEEFINSFDKGEFANKKFLFLRGDKSLRTVPELLKDQSTVDEIVIYRTIENTIDETLKDEIGKRLLKNEIDWICFFSPTGIESFIKTFGELSQNDVKVAAIGTTTAKKAADNNLKIEFVSSKANAEDFAFELIDFIKDIE